MRTVRGPAVPGGSYQLLTPGAARARLHALPARADFVLGALLAEGCGETTQLREHRATHTEPQVLGQR